MPVSSIVLMVLPACRSTWTQNSLLFHVIFTNFAVRRFRAPCPLILDWGQERWGASSDRLKGRGRLEWQRERRTKVELAPAR